jgi:hypothetical protein
MIEIDKSLSSRKSELLSYFCDRATESLSELQQIYGDTDYKKIASEINIAITKSRNNLLTTVLQTADKDLWTFDEKLQTILMLNYVSYVVMIDYRNEVWAYDYMSFSRRIGEFWEPFCKLCFQYSVNDISLFVPPLFSDVKASMRTEIHKYIDRLEITQEEKKELKVYYNKVWSIVDAGQVKLELDLHFIHDDLKIVLDFKSGFGSNEKGNTNRLLLVASVYKSLQQNYQPIILVRSEEDINNNYFQKLKRSGVWQAYCGHEAYEKITEYSSFNIKTWIQSNIDWENDLQALTVKHLVDKKLDSYLKW